MGGVRNVRFGRSLIIAVGVVDAIVGSMGGAIPMLSRSETPSSSELSSLDSWLVFCLFDRLLNPAIRLPLVSWASSELWFSDTSSSLTPASRNSLYFRRAMIYLACLSDQF